MIPVIESELIDAKDRQGFTAWLDQADALKKDLKLKRIGRVS